ncbi:hypothetical protein AB6Q56_06750 [Dechloromonas sp. ARDL1]|uniref:hypothetical protein n=1 Tax=Dechloromonas sp. ARDL1 TaxID=3322121 RepID=UPI003DA70FB6
MKANSALATMLMVALLGFCLTSHAANFSVTCPKSNELDVGCWIDLHGEIIEGDANKLLAIVSSKPKSTDIYRWLVLDSLGGDVAEALKLAKVVRDSMLRTQNFSAAPRYENSGERVYVCASSCVIGKLCISAHHAAQFEKMTALSLSW